jgi:hypothetical protein
LDNAPASGAAKSVFGTLGAHFGAAEVGENW